MIYLKTRNVVSLLQITVNHTYLSEEKKKSAFMIKIKNLLKRIDFIMEQDAPIDTYEFDVLY